MMHRLQLYDDGTYGYLGIDGDEVAKYDHNNEFYNGAKVIYTQAEDESREDFIIKNNLTFFKNQYGSNEKLDRQVNSDARSTIAEQGYGLDKLINDKNHIVRMAVAKHGYGLDRLVNDKSANVRVEVAKQGYGLDILINDKCEDVLRELIKQGYVGLTAETKRYTWGNVTNYYLNGRLLLDTFPYTRD